VSAGLSGYCLNEQKVEGDRIRNLGTSVSGVSAFLTPTVFYNWGAQRLHANAGRAFRVGFGVGAGYLSASGNVIFTETTGERHTFDVSGFGVASAAFMEYRSGRFVSRLRWQGPAVSDRDFEYALTDFYLSAGYLVDI
jgi:hypothetical protein